MLRHTRLWTAAALCAALVLHGSRPAAAQEAVTGTRTSTHGANVGFAYAWSGGFTVGRDGQMRKNSPPRVTQVVPGSASARAGIRVGDVIVSVNGRDSRAMPMFADLKPGDTVVLRIRRGDEEREISYVWPR